MARQLGCGGETLLPSLDARTSSVRPMLVVRLLAGRSSGALARRRRLPHAPRPTTRGARRTPSTRARPWRRSPSDIASPWTRCARQTACTTAPASTPARSSSFRMPIRLSPRSPPGIRELAGKTTRRSPARSGLRRARVADEALAGVRAHAAGKATAPRTRRRGAHVRVVANGHRARHRSSADPARRPHQRHVWRATDPRRVRISREVLRRRIEAQGRACLRFQHSGDPERRRAGLLAHVAERRRRLLPERDARAFGRPRRERLLGRRSRARRTAEVRRPRPAASRRRATAPIPSPPAASKRRRRSRVRFAVE